MNTEVFAGVLVFCMLFTSWSYEEQNEDSKHTLLMMQQFTLKACFDINKLKN